MKPNRSPEEGKQDSGEISFSPEEQELIDQLNDDVFRNTFESLTRDSVVRKELFDPDDMDDEMIGYIEKLKGANSRDLAEALIKKNGSVLTYVPETYRHDKELVLGAMNSAFVFKMLPENLQQDRDVALATAAERKKYLGNNEASNIRFLPENFKHDRQFVLEYMARNGNQLMGLSDVANRGDSVLSDFWHDKGITLAAVGSLPDVIRDVADEFKNDRDVALKAVRGDGMTLVCWTKKESKPGFLEKLSDDEEIVAAAIENNPSAIKYASKRLQEKLKVKTKKKRKE